MLSTGHLAGPALALSVASFGLGFLIAAQGGTAVTRSTSAMTDKEECEEEVVDDIGDGDLSIIHAGLMEPCKLVLVVRTDLKMAPGKIATQCGHATIACYKALVKRNPKLVQHWEGTGQAKIALKATSEEQLIELDAIAKSLNLCARSISDEGTPAVLGIGPAPVSLVNEVTGKLRLL